MAIVKQYHKDTDTTYVYESISYWDPEKGQSRSKRRVIGKLDPETGEIIPTGKRGRTKKEAPVSDAENTQASAGSKEHETDQQKILELQLTITSLNTRLSEMESKLRKYESVLDRIGILSGKLDSLCRELSED